MQQKIDQTQQKMIERRQCPSRLRRRRALFIIRASALLMMCLCLIESSSSIIAFQPPLAHRRKAADARWPSTTSLSTRVRLSSTTAIQMSGGTPIDQDDRPPQLLEDNEHAEHEPKKSLLQKISDKVGKIDETRIISTPEYLNGDVPKLFSNLHYKTQINENGTEIITVATQSNAANVISSSALLCGTALGCGLLNLPIAISSAGYLPSTIATLVAWGYMTISALLTSELLINRYGETGKVRNVGLLELYNSYLGEVGGKLAGIGFLIVSYLVLGVYLSEGGDQLMRLLEMSSSVGGSSILSDSTEAIVGSKVPLCPIFINDSFLARTVFVATMGTFLSTAEIFNTVQKSMTHIFVPLTLVAFMGALVVGLPTADFGALLASENQHPEVVLNAFPLLFMSWTYHGVVPRVVYDLEGDKDKITKAIVLGSTTALVVYLTWNAMILGNALDGTPNASSAAALMGTIQESSTVVLGDILSVAGHGVPSAIESAAAVAEKSAVSLDTLRFKPLLQSSITIVSELAVITSLIGVILGFVNEFNDAIGWEDTSKPYGPREDNKKWKVALLTLFPPAIVSICLGYYSDQYDINNYQIIDYTGIFGSSVLFLILPALMAWQNRYGTDEPPRPLTVRPMVPLGKISLSSLYKAAGTLIVEQGLEKIGVFAFVKDHLHL